MGLPVFDFLIFTFDYTMWSKLKFLFLYFLSWVAFF